MYCVKGNANMLGETCKYESAINANDGFRVNLEKAKVFLKVSMAVFQSRL